MMFLTAKVNLKKILIVAAVIVGVILVLLRFSGDDTEPTAGKALMDTNDARVQFLTDCGWQVAASPVESTQVKIPKEMTEVFRRYNALQISQGYDLTRYAGKEVMRYVYRVDNYPGATEPVYATLLVYKNQVIGGDITDTAANGAIRGFQMPKNNTNTTAPSTAE